MVSIHREDLGHQSGQTLCDTALQAGVEGVSREQGKQARLIPKSFIVSVIVAQRLKASYASYGLS